MSTISTKQLCETLRISKARLGQWTSRGFLTPQEEPLDGPIGYRWTLSDAIRAGVFARLLEIGVRAETAAGAVKYLHGFSDDDCYLVISTGMVGRLIPPTPRGGPSATDETCTKVHTPGHTVCDLIRKNALSSHLANKDFYASVVVNIDEVERLLIPLFSASNAENKPRNLRSPA